MSLGLLKIVYRLFVRSPYNIYLYPKANTNRVSISIKTLSADIFDISVSLPPNRMYEWFDHFQFNFSIQNIGFNNVFIYFYLMIEKIIDKMVFVETTIVIANIFFQPEIRNCKN